MSQHPSLRSSDKDKQHRSVLKRYERIKILKEKGQPLWHIEGERDGSWILLDFGDVVCHLFLEDTRAYYDLEGLWGKAAQERFEEPKPKRAALRKEKAAIDKRVTILSSIAATLTILVASWTVFGLLFHKRKRR